MLDVISGYVEGINAYAEKHPEQVLVKKSLPLTAKDYVIGFNFVIHFFSDISSTLKDLYANIMNNYVALKEWNVYKLL